MMMIMMILKQNMTVCFHKKYLVFALLFLSSMAIGQVDSADPLAPLVSPAEQTRVGLKPIIYTVMSIILGIVYIRSVSALVQGEFSRGFWSAIIGTALAASVYAVIELVSG